MDLRMDSSLASRYHNPTQIARVITESWVARELYCPFCGAEKLTGFENNRPAADFYCERCKEQFELKSKKGALSKSIIGGAYSSMMQRISSSSNPNFICLNYCDQSWHVRSLVLIPKYFIHENMILKRKPLPASARRAGWIGCTLQLDALPDEGKIYLVNNQRVIKKERILAAVKNTQFIDEMQVGQRSWLVAVLQCLQSIQSNEFSLNDVYAYKAKLSHLYPANRNVEAKIRQQLQILRDAAYLRFLGNGIYQKLV